MLDAFRIDDREWSAALSRAPGGYRLHLEDRVLPFRMQHEVDDSWTLEIEGRRVPVVLATHGDDVHVHLDGESFRLTHLHPLERLAARLGSAAEDRILAPMPGSIVSLHVSAGDAVVRGQQLLVMESMKMETAIVAPRDGTVATVHFHVGQTFDRDALLLALEPEAAA